MVPYHDKATAGKLTVANALGLHDAQHYHLKLRSGTLNDNQSMHTPNDTMVFGSMLNLNQQVMTERLTLLIYLERIKSTNMHIQKKVRKVWNRLCFVL